MIEIRYIKNLFNSFNMTNINTVWQLDVLIVLYQFTAVME